MGQAAVAARREGGSPVGRALLTELGDGMDAGADDAFLAQLAATHAQSNTHEGEGVAALAVAEVPSLVMPPALRFGARQQSVLPQLLCLPAALLRAVGGQARG